MCFVAPEPNRVFHYLFAAALLVGSVTYFAQASNFGWDAIHQSSHLNYGTTRQIFYAKYINWAMSFPSLALALGLLSGLSWTTIFTNLFFTWFWVLVYLAAAYTDSAHKWGFYTFGTFAWLILTMSILNEGREAAERLGIGRDYMMLAGWQSFIWLLYPIAAALGDIGNIIGVWETAVFCGVLDILGLPVVAVGFVLLSRGWDFAKLHLDFSEHRFNPNIL